MMIDTHALMIVTSNVANNVTVGENILVNSFLNWGSVHGVSTQNIIELNSRSCCVV